MIVYKVVIYNPIIGRSIAVLHTTHLHEAESERTKFILQGVQACIVKEGR